MAGKLLEVRSLFINGCSKALVQGLLDDLLHEQILSPLEVEYINENNSVRADKCRELIDTVRRKGEYSSNTLLQKIIERDPKYSKELGITGQLPSPIQEQNGLNEKPFDQESPLPVEEQSKKQDINGITLCSEAEYQEITTKEKEMYSIREKSNRTRLALIICNIKFNNEQVKERTGANCDIEGTKKLLEGLGYKVQCAVNLTAQEMKKTMKTFALRNEHKNSDSTFLVFMSHGERGVIYGTDFTRENVDGQERFTADSVLRTDDIFNTFNNVNCPGLRDKPKVIIIQACRGNKTSRVLVSDGPQQPASIKQEDLEDDACRVMLRESDMTCLCATTPDTVCYRHPEHGSLFIQKFIENMKIHAHNLSIEDIFRKVRLSFVDDIQMPTQERNTLVKKFFLFPGY